MADRNDIADAIEALAVHCRPPLMTIEDKMRWVADWCEDLADYPIEAIRAACLRWRNGHDRKFPMPGQLRPLIEAANPKGRSTSIENEPWRPLSDDEYRALSITAKIRHQAILMSEALRKAGPMWRNGKPAIPDDLPASWHEGKRQASHHDSQMRHLRKILKQHDGAA
jgi:hypothetical protein